MPIASPHFALITKSTTRWSWSAATADNWATAETGSTCCGRVRRPPDDPEVVPFLHEDEVLYDDLPPWPSEADGSGQSLQRRRPRATETMRPPGRRPSPRLARFDAGTIRGDFDGNGVVDADDINLLFVQLRSDDPDLSYDLTNDGLVNQADRDELVFSIIGSTYGDANLNLIFNSTDFVIVFQAGQYEDGNHGEFALANR